LFEAVTSFNWQYYKSQHI